MQANKKLVARWRKLKERNDVKDLAALTNKQPSTISRVLAGKQSTTSDVLLIIRDFYKKRSQKVADLIDDNN